MMAVILVWWLFLSIVWGFRDVGEFIYVATMMAVILVW